MPAPVAERGRVAGTAEAYAMMLPRCFVQVSAPDAEAAGDGGEIDPAAWKQFEQRRARLTEPPPSAGIEGLVLDAFVTAGRIPDSDTTASLVVVLVPTTPGPAADLDRLLLARVARGASAVVVGGEAAVAWDGHDERPGGPTSSPWGDGGEVLRRRTVLARVAGTDHLLVSFSFTVVRGQAPDEGRGTTAPGVPSPPDETEAVADALVELFDAMMTTVRWLDEQGRVITDRPTT
jgi:hypothetical protein